jgi:hypothetical protein
MTSWYPRRHGKRPPHGCGAATRVPRARAAAAGGNTPPNGARPARRARPSAQAAPPAAPRPARPRGPPAGPPCPHPGPARTLRHGPPDSRAEAARASRGGSDGRAALAPNRGAVTRAGKNVPWEGAGGRRVGSGRCGMGWKGGGLGGGTGGVRTFAARGKSRGRSSGMASGASACLLLITADGRGRAPDGRMDADILPSRDEAEGGWGWWLCATLCRRRSKKVWEQAAWSDRPTNSEGSREELSFPDQRTLVLFLGAVSMRAGAVARPRWGVEAVRFGVASFSRSSGVKHLDRYPH